MSETNKNILIIRFSSIGDIVLTTPVIRCVAQQLGARVYLLTKAFNKDWLQYNPHVYKIISLDDNNRTEVQKILQSIPFDAVIDLHKNIRSRSYSRYVKAPYYTFPKENINKWIQVHFKYIQRPIRHIVDRYFDAVKPLGIHNDGQGLDMHYPADIESINTLPRSPYIVIALGASYATKRISIKVLQVLISLIEIPIVLVGGQDVLDIASQLDGSDRLTNLVGKISIIQSAYCVGHSELVITGDSAMMHIAAAFQKKQVVIWGSTTPDFGMQAYYGSHKEKHINIEVSDLSCRPCSKLGFDRCPKGHFDCMNTIDAYQVYSAIKQLLN